MNLKEIVICVSFILLFSHSANANSFTKEYLNKINNILTELDVSYQTIITKNGGKLQVECDSPVYFGKDIYGRNQYLIKDAGEALHQMIEDAKRDSVDIFVVSAFRTVDYQYKIVKRKLERGQSLVKILGVSAIPGFSEHHTGRAVDLHTSDKNLEVLTTDFENTRAFSWLMENAYMYGFRLTYPKELNSGIMYEPWHWYFVK